MLAVLFTLTTPEYKVYSRPPRIIDCKVPIIDKASAPSLLNTSIARVVEMVVDVPFIL